MTCTCIILRKDFLSWCNKNYFAFVNSLIVKNWMRWFSVMLVISVCTKPVMAFRTFLLVAGSVILVAKEWNHVTAFFVITQGVPWRQPSEFLCLGYSGVYSLCMLGFHWWQTAAIAFNIFMASLQIRLGCRECHPSTLCKHGVVLIVYYRAQS